MKPEYMTLLLQAADLTPVLKALFDNSISLGLLGLFAWLFWKKMNRTELQYLNCFNEVTECNMRVAEALAKATMVIEQNNQIIKTLQGRQAIPATATKAKTPRKPKA
jgi:hypothetical protein